MKKTLIAAALVLGLSAGAFAADEVFQWKSAKGHNVYSDTPRGMLMGQSNVLNVRTQTITPPTATPASASGVAGPMSLADQQAALNQRIAEENKRNQEAYAKQQAEAKAENCKTARMNRDTVEKSNARNKAQLAPKYDADIAKYCN